MKKDKFLISCFTLLICCSIVCALIAFPGLHTVEAATVNETVVLDSLIAHQKDLAEELTQLQSTLEDTQIMITSCQNDIKNLRADLTNVQTVLVSYYIEKLSDPTYITTQNEYTWYTAAENLGLLGKPAIPALIAKLDTENDYERSLVFYALLLASQADNVKFFTNGDYIDTSLDFNPSSHPEKKQLVLNWWEKYQSYF